MARSKKNKKQAIRFNEHNTFSRNDQNVVKQLELADEKLTGDPSILGISSLTDPMHNNAMRMCMFTSHTKQYVCLLEPDFPFYYMGPENIVGENNNAFKEVAHDTRIVAKLTKFDDMSRITKKDSLLQYIIVQDLVTEEYDIIVRKPAENLTEMFGYEYDNHVIDSYNTGDVIPANERVIQTTSYDEYGNYCFGKNIYSMYVTDPATYEDACVVSESLAKELQSIEIDDVMISINDNDYPLLLRSDDNGYKVLPDIGESTNGVVAAVRTLYNSQVLTDFKLNNLTHMQQSDRRFYLDGEVLDINIYCNNPDYFAKRNTFNNQLVDYYNSQKAFFTRFICECEKIIAIDGKMSANLKYELKRARFMIDEDMKWKEDSTNKPFGGVKINVLVRKKVGITVGQKMTGRAGNKSVTAVVRADEDMPFTDTGKRVDLLFNALGVINRTTALPIHEISITFICDRLIEQLKLLETNEAREKLFFEVMDELNPDQSAYLHDIYINLPTESDRDKFFTDIFKEGIHVRHSTLKPHKTPFFIIHDLENKYEWLKPYDMYIRKFGRVIKCINPAYAGYMHVMKLKQTSKKGFSARGTGAINRKGLPERSYKNKVHQEMYSSTAIRFGEYESLTFEIGIPTEDFAMFHQRYRTSIEGRKDLVKEILKPDGKIEVNEKYTNRAAEILNVYAKTLGFQFKSLDTDKMVSLYDSYNLKEYDGITSSYIATEWDAHKQKLKEEFIQSVLEDEPDIPTNDLKIMLMEYMQGMFGTDFNMDDADDIIDTLRDSVIDND
jgi:hypothetical protein